jgi:uroporphyrinogen-III synthase
MQLLVTRPQPQAEDWVDALRAQQVNAQALPLIAIAPDGADAIAAAWAALEACRLVVFVSPNAVSAFFAQRRAAWPSHVQAGCTGPGTARALAAAGVPAACIVEPAGDAAQFDSESLWARLASQPWAGQRVLVVRGQGGRDWLAERLREHGADVSFVAAYRSAVPTLDAAQRECLHAALAEPAHTVWLFSSSQAVQHLVQLAPSAPWPALQAWATHSRIADTLRARGVGAVQAVRPTIDAVAAAWRASIQSTVAPDQRP